MTVGTLVAFIAYLNVLFTDVHTSIAAAETTFDFLDENFSIPDDGKAVVRPIKTHEFSDVCFAYNDEFGLQHVTFRIDPHQKHIAVTGENGSGKSTLGALLFRFYDVISGCIKSTKFTNSLPIA